MLTRARLYLTIAFFILFISIFYGFIKSIEIYGIKEFYESRFGDFAVATGTLVLGIFTAYLGIVETEESKKERRRLSLK